MITSIAGIDASITGTAVVKYVVDSEMSILSSDYIAFCSVKKNVKGKVVFCKKDQFANDLERFHFIGEKVADFIRDCEYVAFEDYAFGAMGKVFNIGEFTGNLKLNAWREGKKLQFYDPNSIKMFAGGKGHGNANKMEMKAFYDSVKNCHFKPDLTDFPVPVTKTGITPTSDIVDAFFICDMLHTEIMLRKGLLNLRDLDEATISVFNRTTKAEPTNILARELVQRNIK